MRSDIFCGGVERSTSRGEFVEISVGLACPAVAQIQVTGGARLKRYLVRGVFAVSSLVWALSAALVAGAVVGGRARPWEGSLAFLLVFAGVAGPHLVAMGLARKRAVSGGLLRLLIAGLAALALVIPIYASDSWNNAVAEDAFLKGLTLAALLLPWVVFVGIERVSRLRLGVGRGSRVEISLPLAGVLVVAAAGFLDLVVKVAVGAEAPAWLWVGMVPMLLGGLAVFGRVPGGGARMTRSVYLGPLLAPTVFAFLTHADTHLRLLVLTSGGARLLTGLLLVVALGVAYLLRPTAGVSTDFRREVVDRVGRARYWLIGTSLLGIGILQAGSYRVVAMDDLARYWIIAEDIMGGRGYPAWAGGGGIAQAAAGELWVDPPVFPLLVAASFGVAGHLYHSVQIPIVLANVALPALLFVAFRALVGRDDIALGAALLTVLFPPFQIHLLGAAEPDAVFVVELVLAMWLLARIGRAQDFRWLEHAGLGVVLVTLALTRPEGLVYAGVMGLWLAAFRRSWEGATAGGVVLAGVVAFAAFIALTTDARWPPRSSGFAMPNIGENLEYVRTNMYWYYVRVLLLNDVRAPLLLLLLGGSFLFGVWTLARRGSVLAALPAAMLVNLTLTLAVDPEVLRADEPAELFRHLAYGLPIVAAGAAVGAWQALRRLPRRIAWPGPLAGLVMVALIGGEIYVLATPEEMYHWNKSGSLLRGGDIYVEAVELFQNPIALPCDGCFPEEAGAGFAGFRERLFDHYREFDMHGDTVGISYEALTGVLSAVALAVVMVRPGGGVRAAGRWRGVWSGNGWGAASWRRAKSGGRRA